MGADAAARGRFGLHHPAALDQHHDFALAERAGNHRHDGPPADRRGRSGKTRKVPPYIATLFLFIATSNLCTIIPGYEPPTGSLSTTAALALSVFIAVPLFGIAGSGLKGYLKSYIDPTPIMLPFNIIGDFTRTMALAVRLFGNMMSGDMILVILLTISPLIFPVLMSILGLLTGMVQAYIFSILATVYIAAATRTREK
nr:F0F1 ATP synthase subunit A [Chlorobaculum thiosulfatiphilum]